MPVNCHRSGGWKKLRCRSAGYGRPEVYDRRAPQDHLADHKLSVIFSNSPRSLCKSGIRQVSALRPFPSPSPPRSARPQPPFPFGRQSTPLPGRESSHLVIVDMTNWPLRSGKGRQSRIVLPTTIDQMPIQRRAPSHDSSPNPSLRRASS